MKAVEISRIGFSKLIEASIPEPKSGEVLIKIKASGICASDIAAYLGKHPYRVPPVISGHESAGVIVSLGAGVTEFKTGDRVIIEPQIGCGVCSSCKDGDYNICMQKRLMGTPAWPGGFAEYVSVPYQCAYKIPDEIPYPEATLVEPFSVALHAVERAGSLEGKTVAVLGTGAIGLMIVLACTLKKAAKIICSDIKDQNLDFAVSLGAANKINPGKSDVRDKVIEYTDGNGADIVFVSVGVDSVLNDAINITRPKGKVIAVANFNEFVQVEMPKIQLKEREIIGTSMYTHKDYNQAIRMLPDILKQLTGFITHRITIEELPKMLGSIANKEIQDAVKVIVCM